MTRILSGIQPSGLPHIGNYFGAIKQHVQLQDEGEALYFIADYHALTTVRDAETLREWIYEYVATYLALGLDPERAIFFRQSDIREILEITWLLTTVTGMGLLERAHSYKDKTAKGIKPSVGLFTYPVLMSSDILSYDSDLVPVGKDQVQHVEFAQDMAGYFNQAYGEVFRRPEWRLSETPKVKGLDGEKMSKSYGNHLWIFEEGKALKKRVNKIVTDSAAPEDPKELEGTLIHEWLGLFVTKEECDELVRRARAGGPDGPGYGELKKRVIQGMDELFGEAREERKRLLADKAHLDGILERGAKQARAFSEPVRERAFKACGLI